VTPALAPPARRTRAAEGTRPKKRRASAVFDADGHEVLITLMCLKCRQMKPLAQFGLRKMPDGAIRNQPWCRPCRSAASTKKKPAERKVDSELDSNLQSDTNVFRKRPIVFLSDYFLCYMEGRVCRGNTTIYGAMQQHFPDLRDGHPVVGGRTKM